ncbi:MAG: OB-fold domain-containing protein [Deltaproteobacteria bacterium]|nr:OB-fold domain-containing protein [Deltaproteobacteria bacterium]
MIGITSYGAYIPRYRLPLGALGGRRAGEGGPEKAVAWNDEDSVTMAVAAAGNCLRDFDRQRVDALYFASTSYAFREKQAAALVARALDLPRDLHCADFASSLRAGTSALRAAADAVKAGSARCVLVVASDCRLGAPGSGLERNSGDGAAAFLVCDADVIAVIEAAHSVSDEIVDVWRGSGDTFVHSWEDRFVVQEGYVPRTLEAVQGLLEKSGCAVSDFAKLALYAPDQRSHATVARQLGIEADSLCDPLFGRLGNAGAAFAPLQLAAALEAARPGDRILVANYGDGADALAFSVSDPVEKLEPRRGVSWHLERRRPVASYDEYLSARGMGTSEWEAPAGPGLSATIHFRDRDNDISFRGQKCNGCGAVQFPVQRVCETCFKKDDFEAYRLSDRIGKLVTYTFDYFFPTPDPPTVVSIVDIDGARVHIQVVNCRPEDVKAGLPVEFEFRRIHEVGGRPNYYWKATPRPASD